MNRCTALFALAFLGAAIAAAQANPQRLPTQNPPFFGKDGKKRTNPNMRSVQGVVLNEDGKPVERAIVELKELKTGKGRTFTTRADGRYRFDDLVKLNDYELKAATMTAESPVRRITQFTQSNELIFDLTLAKKEKERTPGSTQ